MKTNYSILLTMSVAMLINVSCKKKGCTDPMATNYSEEAKKDDETCAYVPTITLNGAATVSAELNEPYVDAGATASNKDGSSVNVTADASSVNTSQTGSYIVNYTATNESGTANASRTVNVVFSQDYWISSTWNITSDCGLTAFPLSSPPTISAGSTSSDLIFDSFFTLVGGTANAIISGETITFPNQTMGITGGDVIFSGSGSMNSSGTEITVNYNYENTVLLFGGEGSCTAVYTKQ